MTSSTLYTSQPATSAGQDTRTSPVPLAVRRLGFWSGILTTIWTVWFTAAFIPYMASMPASWPGIEAFAASFEPGPYLAWVIPCLLLALTFPVLLSCIHFATAEERKIWSWLGLLFGLMYGAVLSTNYWLLYTVVQSSLVNGYTDGLSWFVIGSPHSITNSLEGIGYGFMGLAMLFAGPAFAGSRLDRAVRWLFIFNGASGLGGVIALGVFGSMLGSMISLGAWCLTFPVATALAALRFRASAVREPELPE